jgi:hypothetical protein
MIRCTDSRYCVMRFAIKVKFEQLYNAIYIVKFATESYQSLETIKQNLKHCSI